MDAIDRVQENDFIVYLDAGCALNKLGRRRFHEYISMLENSEYGVLSFQMSGGNGFGDLHVENRWTTSNIFKYFGEESSSDIGQTGQYLGGVFILRKNDHLRKYMEGFKKVLDTDPYLLTDKYNSDKHHPEFHDNRHDQSITSVLRKKIGSVVVDGDESWVPPFGIGRSLQYPFWAMRSKN